MQVSSRLAVAVHIVVVHRVAVHLVQARPVAPPLLTLLPAAVVLPAAQAEAEAAEVTAAAEVKDKIQTVLFEKYNCSHFDIRNIEISMFFDQDLLAASIFYYICLAFIK